MTHAYRLDRSTTRPRNVVLVTLTMRNGDWLAEVEWPANGRTIAGSYLYATGVPLALERARDVMATYGFAEIVVRLPDTGLWQPEWGRLVY